MKLWGQSFSGSGSSRCKGPEAGMSLVGLEGIESDWMEGGEVGDAGRA